MEDRLSSTEIMTSDKRSDLDKLIGTTRDSAMIGALRSTLASPEAHWKSIAIVVGAAHTRAIFSFLINEKRFYTVRTKWLTVFGPEPGLD